MDNRYGRGRNPRSLANLKPVKKGDPPLNPKGRPPRPLCLTEVTRDELSKPCPKAPGKTWLEHLRDRWLELASDNVWALKELLARLEGVVPLGPPDVEQKVTFVIGKGYFERPELPGREAMEDSEEELEGGKSHDKIH